MKFKGAVFDMDGTMLDTEKLHIRFWFVAAKDYGFQLKLEDLMAARGMTGETGKRHFQACYGENFDYDTIKQYRNEIIRKYCDENGVELKPGVHEILRFLKDQGVRLAVATSNMPDRAEQMMRDAGLWDYFDEHVFGTAVKRSKPAPDIFLHACEQLGLSPADCLVFEDSDNGVLAAASAGCAVVMIPDLAPPTNEVRAAATTVQDDLFGAMEWLKQNNFF